MPVARQVLAHAARTPDQVAVVAGDASLTYAELAGHARAEAAALVRDGVRPGHVVALDLAGGAPGPPPAPTPAAPEKQASRMPDDASHPVETLVALLAVDLAGAVALMCDATWTPAQRTDILAATGPDHHLTALVTPQGRAERPVPPSPAANGDSTFVPASASDDDLAWGGFTSGSTGRPRAVVRTRGSWTRSFEATSQLTTITADDTVLVPGPLSTSLFCFGAAHALATGATVRLAPSILASISDLATSDVVHLVPGALVAVLDALDSPDPAQCRLRVAVVGGAALPPGTRERASRHGIAVVAYYGATELSFVAIDPDGEGLRPFPGVEIEIRDSGSGVPALLAGGTTGLGEVWVRSPWIAHGYLAGAAGPLRAAGGWASVGDLAEMAEMAEMASCDATGASSPRLLLRGRGSGAIEVGAATVVPEDVEAVLRTVLGVADVVVLGTGHPRLGQVVTAVVVGCDGADPDLGVLEGASRTRLSPAQRPRRWFVTDALPVTGTGKPARAVVQKDLAIHNPAYRVARRRSTL